MISSTVIFDSFITAGEDMLFSDIDNAILNHSRGFLYIVVS